MMWLRPWSLLLLLPWLVSMFWLWRHHRQGGRWSRLMDPQMLSALNYQPSDNRQRLAWWALASSGVLVIIALAGPASSMPGATTLSQGSLVVVLDNSLSMAVEDVTPSRSERARRTVLDWAGSGTFQRTAVIAYSGSAHWLTPFTRDTETLALQLNQLDPFIMPQFGNRPDLAFAAVAEKQRQLAGQRLHLLWLTDDASPEHLGKLQESLVHRGQTWVMPVGSEGGGPIPLPGDQGFFSMGEQMVVPKVNRNEFDRVSRQLGAQLLPLGSQPRLDLLGESSREETTDQAVREWGFWLLLPAMVLLLPWYRRGLVFALPLLMVLPPQEARAQGFADSLLKSHEERAFEAYREGDWERSLEMTQRPELAAAAAFEAGQYGAAIEHWRQLDTADAHYNRGNALVRQGELEAALDAYQEAIDLSGHEMASQNRQKVEDFLERQQQDQEQQSQDDSQRQEGDEQEQQPSQGEQSRQNQSESGSESEAPDSEEPSASQDDPSGAEDQTGESEGDEATQDDPEEAAAREAESGSSADGETREQQLRNQAVEQLLNRLEIPSARVLQRKLRYEFQQAPTEQDESQLW